MLERVRHRCQRGAAAHAHAGRHTSGSSKAKSCLSALARRGQHDGAESLPHANDRRQAQPPSGWSATHSPATQHMRQAGRRGLALGSRSHPKGRTNRQQHAHTHTHARQHQLVNATHGAGGCFQRSRRITHVLMPPPTSIEYKAACRGSGTRTGTVASQTHPPSYPHPLPRATHQGDCCWLTSAASRRRYAIMRCPGQKPPSSLSPRASASRG